MKILFDLRIYDREKNRGIGRYIYCLINNLLNNYKDLDISIIMFGKEKIFGDLVRYYQYGNLDLYTFDSKFDYWFFDDLHLPKFNKTNTFIDEIFPKKILLNTKRIVAIGHDLISLVFGEVLKNNKYFFYQIESYYICDHIFVNSNSTKNDFIKYLKLHDDNITTIYGGVDEKFVNINNENEYSYSSRENSIIFISNCNDLRKNIIGLIKGFAIAYSNKNIPKDSKIYVCGNIDDDNLKMFNREIKKLNLSSKQIIFTNHISDEEMIKLISVSKANFLPSFYEGLGFSILESYACTTASFASNISSMKELVLEKCSFNPNDFNSIAKSIELAFNDEALCIESVKFGKKLLKEKCSWDIAAKLVYDKLLEINNYITIDFAIFTSISKKSSYNAYYDIKNFGVLNNCHIFSNIKSHKTFKYLKTCLKEKFQNNFIPIEYYERFLNKYVYNKKIFTLANSKYYTDCLKYAIKEKDKLSSYIYLYDINCISLIFSLYDNSIEKLKNIIKEYYNFIYDDIKDYYNVNIIFKLLNKKNIYGIKAILNLTNINNIIIHNINYKNMILEELKLSSFDKKLNIIENSIPIIDFSYIKPLKIDHFFHIGAFSIRNNRYIDLINEAIYLLNIKYNNKFKLILSKNKINKYSKYKNQIIYFRSINTKKYLSTMQSVDISIEDINQLKIIYMLLGMNKKIIAINNSNLELDYDIKKLLINVDHNIKADNLALKILQSLESKLCFSLKDVEKYNEKINKNIMAI